MSEYSDEDYNDEETAEATGPKALRDALKKERKEKTDALKRLADLETKFAEADKANRATLLKEALTAAGGPAASKIAAFYPADSEVTADAVKSWLDQNKDVFNLTPATESGDETKETKEPLDPAVQAYIDSQARTGELESERLESPGEEQLVSEIRKVARNAKSMQEIAEGYAKLGGPVTNSGYRR